LYSCVCGGVWWCVVVYCVYCVYYVLRIARYCALLRYCGCGGVLRVVVECVDLCLMFTLIVPYLAPSHLLLLRNTQNQNHRTTQKYARSAPFSPLSSFLRVFEKKKERRDHTALKERMGRHGLHAAHPKSWEKHHVVCFYLLFLFKR
jgi:hypothetical protein